VSSEAEKVRKKHVKNWIIY